MSQPRVAADIGSQLAKIVTDPGPADHDRPRILPVGPDGAQVVLGELAVTGAELCLAVPDAWLDGSEAGARKQERLRRITEDELGLRRVRWAGQLAAVAALAAGQRTSAPGRYLVCDVGGAGVRVGLCEVGAGPAPGGAVRHIAVHAEAGGGWRDFDHAIRTELGAERDPGLHAWPEQAAEQERRASLVFARARTSPDFLAARLYSLTGAHGVYELTARQATECFALTADRIRTGITAALSGAAGGDSGLITLLAGGLAWFPLAAAVIADSTGTPPVVMPPEAAARGALLIADDQAGLGQRGLPAVSLPVHQVRNGLLEQASVPLSWTCSFAGNDDPLPLDGEEIVLDIGVGRVTVPLAGLAPGYYRAAVRPSWADDGILVLRAEQVHGRWPTVDLSPATHPKTVALSRPDADSGARIVPLGPYVKR